MNKKKRTVKGREEHQGLGARDGRKEVIQGKGGAAHGSSVAPWWGGDRRGQQGVPW